eukprot:448330_1
MSGHRSGQPRSQSFSQYVTLGYRMESCFEVEGKSLDMALEQLAIKGRAVQKMKALVGGDLDEVRAVLEDYRLFLEVTVKDIKMFPAVKVRVLRDIVCESIGDKLDVVMHFKQAENIDGKNFTTTGETYKFEGKCQGPRILHDLTK